MLPDINGYEILKIVRSNNQTATLPFVFMTGRNSHADMRTGMELGANDYLTKPFTPQELISAVQARLKIQDAHETHLDTTPNGLRKKISYSIPHELRTPLMIIEGYADLLTTDSFAADRADIQRLNRLVENYIIYTQIQTAFQIPQELDALRNFIEPNAAEIISKQAQKIAQVYNRADDLPLEIDEIALAISPDNLEKIVMELTDNAFKFSRPGCPITVRSVREDRAYTLLCTRPGVRHDCSANSEYGRVHAV